MLIGQMKLNLCHPLTLATHIVLYFFSDSSVSCHSCNYSSGRTWHPPSKSVWYACCKCSPYTCSFSVFPSSYDSTKHPCEPCSATDVQFSCPPHASSQPSSYYCGFLNLALPNNCAKYAICSSTITCCRSFRSVSFANTSCSSPAISTANVPGYFPADNAEWSSFFSPSHSEHASSFTAAAAAAASTSSVTSAKHNSSFRTDYVCIWGW